MSAVGAHAASGSSACAYSVTEQAGLQNVYRVSEKWFSSSFTRSNW